MSDRFIKLIPSEETDYLITQRPNAFLLLTLIAKRARRSSNNPDGLDVGEAYVGDNKKCGLTKRQYRTALKILEQRAHIKIIETCRNRKKSTTGTTTVGTKVKLISSNVYDINLNENDHRNDHRATTERPPSDHEQERIIKKKKEKNGRQPTNPIHSSHRSAQHNIHNPDIIHFDRETNHFKNISQEDMAKWRELHPKLNIDVELDRMKSWLISEDGLNRNGGRLFIANWLKKEDGYQDITPSKIIIPEPPQCEIDPFVEQELKIRKEENIYDRI